jgi:hypothetical protein
MQRCDILAAAAIPSVFSHFAAILPQFLACLPKVFALFAYIAPIAVLLRLAQIFPLILDILPVSPDLAARLGRRD